MKTLKLTLALASLLASTLTPALAGPISWDGGGEDLNWTNALNWSGNVLPGPADDVFIGAGPGPITFSGANVTLKSLVCSRPLALASGRLNPTNGLTLGVDANLTVSGVGTELTATGPTTVNAALTAQGGGAIRLPGLTQVIMTQALSFATYDAGTLLDLSGVTNVDNGAEFRLTLSAYSGSRIDLRRARFSLDYFYAYADGEDSVVDLSGLSGRLSSSVAAGGLAAYNRGTVLMPNVTELDNFTVDLRYDGQAGATQWRKLTRCSMTCVAVTNILPALTNIDTTSWNVQAAAQVVLTNVKTLKLTQALSFVTYEAGTLLDLSGVTNVDNGGEFVLNLWAYSGSRIDLRRARFSLDYFYAYADGDGSLVDLSGLVGIAIPSGYQTTVTASHGGKVDLRQVQSIFGASCKIVSENAGSVVDLSSLLAFATPMAASELTAKTGGMIILSSNVFLLANVEVTIADNPLLPSYVSPSADVSLYGEPWLSYWVEVRDTRDPASPWELFMRVPLTNAIQVISGPPQPWQAFRVREFVADPAIVDLKSIAGGQLQLVLYGAPPKSFELLTTGSPDAPSAGWAVSGTTGPMTNSFRLFPSFPPAEAKRFYRGKEL